MHLSPPRNDPRTAEAAPLPVYAVYVHEEDAPADETPVEWMLLTSEPVTCFADAQRIINFYRCRWVIEEWHRVLKEGCRLESSQLDDAEDLKRLAAIQSVIAVRLLQLRDLADEAGDDTEALQQFVPALWITVVAALSDCPPNQLTPEQFWLTIAQQGGYLNRQHDPRPGWKAIWQGWYDIQRMVQGAELFSHPPKCG